MTDLRERALQQIDAAVGKPASEMTAEVDEVERTVAALRDELIEQWRGARDAGTREALDRVNAALSLIVGLEYSDSGVERELLTQARSALAEMGGTSGDVHGLPAATDRD